LSVPLEQGQHIRRSTFAGGTGGAAGTGVEAGAGLEPQIALAQERYDRRPLVTDTVLGAGVEDAREPGMQRHPHQPLTDGREPASLIDRTQVAQQGDGRMYRSFGRRFEEGERRRIRDALRVEREHRLGEVQAPDLGDVVFGPAVEVVSGVEAEAVALTRATRAAGALDGRCPADLRDP